MPNPNEARLSLKDWINREGLTQDSFWAWAETVDGTCPALCRHGCEVEPDGYCEHACPSVLLATGLI